ncbi:hypothetical protein ATANTOWER_027770 [Ataeniobius toweri]|uniref:Uncharacterized protein n=1 Tax=Ataeniobius toweri TaxID=208326 RepID=A0ABU7AMS8_9TELE|nr:hypothetical protein [Ataeniobius toweri]
MVDMDFTDLITVFYLWRAEKCRRRRRPWVHQILQGREQFGDYHHLLQELRLDDDRFQQYFRLSGTQFEDLLSCVGRRIGLWDTNYQCCIPAAECLSICLRLASRCRCKAPFSSLLLVALFLLGLDLSFSSPAGHSLVTLFFAGCSLPSCSRWTRIFLGALHSSCWTSPGAPVGLFISCFLQCAANQRKDHPI